jgi:hypothetical protein
MVQLPFQLLRRQRGYTGLILRAPPENRTLFHRVKADYIANMFAGQDGFSPDCLLILLTCFRLSLVT